MNATALPQSAQLAAGLPLATLTSQFYVVNIDSKTATADPDDAVEAALTGSATNVILVPVPANASYMELVHLYVGSDPTTALQATVFGFVPFQGQFPQERYSPYDVDANYPNLDGLWAALTDPLDPTTTRQDFDNTPVMESNVVGSVYKMSKPKLVHLAGATKAVVLIGQAANNATRGLIVARFRS